MLANSAFHGRGVAGRGEGLQGGVGQLLEPVAVAGQLVTRLVVALRRRSPARFAGRSLRSPGERPERLVSGVAALELSELVASVLAGRASLIHTTRRVGSV